MAVPSNTYQTYQTVGIREDLEDLIYNIAPTETPFINSIDKVSATQTNHEWQTDTLATPATNAQIEGDDATADAATATVRLGNYTQIFRKVPQVAGTDIIVKSAGRKNELNYQIAKRGMELRRDIENAVVGANTAKSAGNATTARYLGSYDAWVATNVSKASDGTNPSPVDGSDARGDGTQRAFTEDLLKAVLQGCWTSGGDPTVIMTGAFNKRILSTFTGNATRFVDAKTDTLNAAIAVYESDYGQLKVVPNRFSRTRDVLVVDPKYWGLAYLRPMQVQDLSKTGDSDRKMLIAELTLVARNEAASGLVADLTTS